MSMNLIALGLGFWLQSSNMLSLLPVVLISIDGLRPDAMFMADTPNIKKLFNRGYYFSKAYTVRPSQTLPSHTSMITGLSPDKHGITWDDYRPEYGPVKYPTALEIAHNNGLSSALFVAKEKLKHLKRPDSLNHFEISGQTASSVADGFNEYVKNYGLPNFSMIHLPDPDRIGHFLGWMSSPYLYAVHTADKAVGKIVEALERTYPYKYYLILTADHGGKKFNHVLDIEENNHIPWLIVGPDIPHQVNKKYHVKTYDTAATVLELLKLPVPSFWDGVPIPVRSLINLDSFYRPKSPVEPNPLSPL